MMRACFSHAPAGHPNPDLGLGNIGNVYTSLYSDIITAPSWLASALPCWGWIDLSRLTCRYLLEISSVLLNDMKIFLLAWDPLWFLLWGSSSPTHHPFPLGCSSVSQAVLGCLLQSTGALLCEILSAAINHVVLW